MLCVGYPKICTVIKHSVDGFRFDLATTLESRRRIIATPLLVGRSWRVVLAAAGAGVSVPGLLRQIAFHRAWAVVLAAGFVALALVALA